MTQEQGIGDFNWAVQVGPGLEGSVGGYVNGTSATFLVLPSGITGQIYAVYSTDSGGTWNPIPPGQPFSVSGGGSIQWRVEVPQDGDAKFLIGDIGA